MNRWFFGAPIAFNPYLMIPMWINALIVPTISYVVMNMGFVNIPSQSFLLWYMPYPFTSYLATQDFPCGDRLSVDLCYHMVYLLTIF